MARLILPLALLLFAASSLPRRAHADDATPPHASGTHDSADDKIDALIRLLADPAVRSRLAATAIHEEAPAPEPAAAGTMSASLGDRLQSLKNHLVMLAQAGRDVPFETAKANSMARTALSQWGLVKTVLSLVTFVGLGFCGQGLFHLAGRPAFRWLMTLKLETVEDRLLAVFARFAYGLGLVAAYALCSIGAFLLFDWPPLIKLVLLGALIAFLIVRLTAVVSRFLLAPGAERFRVVPVSTDVAWFLHVRLIAAAALASFGWQALSMAARFGFSAPAGELTTDALGLVVLVMTIETIWRLPAPREPGSWQHGPRRRLLAALVTVLAVLVWLLWIADLLQAAALLAFATLLPIVIGIVRASVVHILRPTGDDETHSFGAVLFARGVRSLIIIGAALVFAWICDIDVVSLTMRDTVSTRILRGLVSVIVIALAADFLWTLIRALIDRKLNSPLPHGSSDSDAGHAARLQTLLPIIGNILFAAILTLAGMMMLSALGVQIGPLIASAGVVGVAIGFGAQTLVRDVISGIFYLVDDAFRIGEYIQSGNYKGTVESFSLRSVKLRHQRGALYTVPFGVLGAVQNQSRDWVVDKIVMNVPYGTDLEKVRKLVKKIGTTLAEDPEFGPDIINPLKMQGVQQFGDYAIQIQTKMMTKPGDVQFMARRRALLLIKQAFEENGILFAVPTVQVSGEGPASASAAASAGLVLREAPKAAE